MGGHNVLFIELCCDMIGGGGPSAPTVFDSVTWDSTSGNTTFSVTLPDYEAGDIVYLFFIQDGTTQTLAASGWANEYDNVVIPTTARMCVFRKEMVGDEGLTATVTSTVTERATCVGVTVRGDGGVVDKATNASGTLSPASINELTTTVETAIILGAIFTDGHTLPHSDMTNLDVVNSWGFISGGSVSVYMQAADEIDTYAADSATLFANDEWLGIRFSIQPEG